MSTLTAEKTAFLPVSPDEAFALITEPERLRRWKTVSARVDLRAGGEYRWTIVPGHVATGTFREIEPGKRIVFGWGWEGSDNPAPDTSTVTVTLEPVEGGTNVTLIHEGLTAEQIPGHLEGWTHFLGRLEIAAAKGEAGPDEWAWAPADLNLLTSADATLAVLQNVVRTITDADLTRPTPCSEYDVAKLTEHLLGSLTGVAGMAGRTLTLREDGTLEERIADAAQQTMEAWHQRGTDGMVPFGKGELPASVAAAILSVEFLIHAWDYATATGQTVHVSDEVTAFVLDTAEGIIDGGRDRGSFASEIATPIDAPVLDRLIAFSGRTAA